MLTRRAFLLGSAGATAGLILPSWVKRAEQFIETMGEPLIEPPRQASITIDAYDLGDGDLRLLIGSPYEEPPTMTWLQYYQWYYADWIFSFDEFVEELFWSEIDPSDEADRSLVLESWLAANEAPDTKAFAYLSDFDIGSELGSGDSVGRIDFVDGVCPGNDSRFVTVPDLLSLSLLQKRLNHVDGKSAVRLAGHL